MHRFLQLAGGLCISTIVVGQLYRNRDFEEPRVTTRRWMIAIAIAGLMLGGLVSACRLWRRHEVFLLRHQYHMRMSAWCAVQGGVIHDSSRIYDRITDLLEGRKAGLDIILGLLSSRPLLDADRPTVARLHRITAYHAAMARKYLRAARYPWLAVEPDRTGPGQERDG
jgi:hypothetical protein